MKTHIATFLLFLALPLFAFMGASKVCAAQKSTEGAFKVAFLTDSTPGDCSTGDYVREELLKTAAGLGVKAEVIRSTNPEKQSEDFAGAAKTGAYDLVILADKTFTDILFDQAGNYPKTRFAAIDRLVRAPNIVSVEFADYEASFLAGAASAILTTRTGIKGINADQKIAFLGGKENSRQRALLDSFTMGARHVAPDTKVFHAFMEDVSSPQKGREAAMELFDTGSDIIMHSAGKAGLGVIAAAKETGLYAIGMDVDQSALAPANVAASIVKRFDLALQELLGQALAGKLKSNAKIEMNLKNGGVVLALTRSPGDASTVLPADIIARLKELTYEISRGTLKVLPPKRAGKLCDC